MDGGVCQNLRHCRKQDGRGLDMPQLSLLKFYQEVKISSGLVLRAVT